MKKYFVIAIVGILGAALAACDLTTTTNTTVQTDIQTLEASLVADTQLVCKYVPDAETVSAIVAAYIPGAQPVVAVAAGYANEICAAVTAAPAASLKKGATSPVTVVINGKTVTVTGSFTK